MNKQLIEIIKIDLKSLVSNTQRQMAKNTKFARKTPNKFLKALIFSAFTIYLIAMLFGWFTIIADEGFSQEIPLFSAILVVVLIVIQQFSYAGAYILDRKNFERLLSLPIPYHTIVITRMLGIYVMPTIYALIIFSVAGVVLSAHAPLLHVLMMCVVGVVCTPLIPLCLCVLLTMSVHALQKKARISQKSLNIIMLLVLGVPAILAYIALLSGMINPLSTETLATVRMIFFIYAPLAEIYSGSYVFALLFIAVHACLLVLAIKLFSTHFNTITQLSSAQMTQDHSFSFHEHLEGAHTADTATLAAAPLSHVVPRKLRMLLSREFKQMMEISIYLMNYGMIYLLSFVCIIGVGIGFYFDLLPIEAMWTLSVPMRLAAPVLVVCFPALLPTTSCAYSLEGNSWWILQTSPIHPKEIALSKLLFALIPTLVLALCSFATALINLPYTLIELGLMVLVMISSLLLLFIVNLWQDMRYAEMSWATTKNYQRVLKGRKTSFFSFILGYITLTINTILMCLLTIFSAEFSVYTEFFIYIVLGIVALCALYLGLSFLMWKSIVKRPLSTIG